MKRLITTETGGHPLNLDDIGFIQDGIKEQLANLSLAFGGSTVLLYGQETDGINKTAGAIFYNDEIYSVPLTPTAQTGGSNTLRIVTNYDPLSPVTYKDTSIKNVHEVKSMEWNTTGGVDTGITFAAIDSLRVSNVLLDSVFDEKRWSNLTANVNFVLVQNVDLIKQGNTIKMRGRIRTTNTSTGLNFASGIPASMIPTVNRIVPAMLLKTASTGKVETVHVTVKTDGTIAFDETLYGAASLDEIILDNSYYTK